MFDVIVVGGGFRGLLVSYLALKRDLKVALVESSGSLGGFLNSFQWNNFIVDRGVQLFDSVPIQLQEIVAEELGIDVEPIDFTYGSVYDGQVTPGFALPNYSSISKRDKERILFELVERIDLDARENCNLEEFLTDRYGPTATKYMAASFKNIYRLDLNEADSSALSQTAFHRLYFLNDQLSIKLKQHPQLDQKLAARRAAIGKVDDFVSFYPKTGGMKGVADGFAASIKKLGGSIHKNMEIGKILYSEPTGCWSVEAKNSDTKLSGKNIVWCSPVAELEKILNQKSTIADLEHGTPMSSYMFEVNAASVNNYTYFHQFSPSTFVYRSSAMGLYSGQINDAGKTFVTAECPTDIGSDFWNDPESHKKHVWRELKEMDLLTENVTQSEKFQFAKLGITHRIPKFGHAAASALFEAHVKENYPNIILDGYRAFLRRDIFLSSDSLVKSM